MDPINNPNVTATDHLGRAKQLVFDYVKERLEKTDSHITFSIENVYIVSFEFILGGWKARVSTTLPDQMYYEVTYNKLKSETYFDAYKKWENLCIKDEDA